MAKNKSKSKNKHLKGFKKKMKQKEIVDLQTYDEGIRMANAIAELENISAISTICKEDGLDIQVNPHMALSFLEENTKPFPVREDLIKNNVIKNLEYEEYLVMLALAKIAYDKGIGIDEQIPASDDEIYLVANLIDKFYDVGNYVPDILRPSVVWIKSTRKTKKMIEEISQTIQNQN